MFQNSRNDLLFFASIASEGHSSGTEDEAPDELEVLRKPYTYMMNHLKEMSDLLAGNRLELLRDTVIDAYAEFTNRRQEFLEIFRNLQPKLKSHPMYNNLLTLRKELQAIDSLTARATTIDIVAEPHRQQEYVDILGNIDDTLWQIFDKFPQQL